MAPVGFGSTAVTLTSIPCTKLAPTPDDVVGDHFLVNQHNTAAD